jgi:hypothetical protein
LRSGSRYRRWREGFESKAAIRRIRTLEQFDPWTDVDVFALVAEPRRDGRARRPRWIAPAAGQRRVGDEFEVCVGPVVPHRDPKNGPLRPYVHAQSLPATGEVRNLGERRRHSGRAIDPPFIVVRRTSRPSTNGTRLRGNIIRGTASVFVENHLIVLKPMDGTLRSCRALLAHLLSFEVTSLLNARIRCRHLTVRAIRDLPWFDV